MSVSSSARMRRKLPASFNVVALPLLLSVLMTCVVSAIATLHSVGLTPGIVDLWLGAWGLSWIIAFPTLLVVLPLVRRIVAALVEPPRNA